MKQYSVYITTNASRTLYVGVTNDLARRVQEHRQKLVPGFTSKCKITQLVWYESFGRPADAIACEKQLNELERRRTEFNKWVEQISSLRPGDKVRVPKFDREGVVVRVQLKKQVALVSVGAMEMEVPLTELRPA